jgi:formylglycine-generating enzyme required for sulfatase activity
MTTTQSAAQELRAEQYVSRLVRRFAPSYQWLLYYAALPLVLTPELLNYLRNQFLRDKHVPWVAEVDLLLSDLCHPVGNEQYAMDSNIRDYLIRQAIRELGQVEIERVARLLVSYVNRLAQTNPYLTMQERRVQQWAAMVFVDSARSQVAQDIAEAFRDCDVTDSANPKALSLANRDEMRRLSGITKTLASQLTGYDSLVQYAQAVTQALYEPEKLDPNQFRAKFQIGDVTVKIPKALRPEKLDEFDLQPFDFFDARLVDEHQKDDLPAVPKTTLLVTVEQRDEVRYYVDGWLILDPAAYKADSQEGVLQLSTLEISRYIDTSQDPNLLSGLTSEDIPAAIAAFLDQAINFTPEKKFSIHVFLPWNLIELPLEQEFNPQSSNSKRRVYLGIGPRSHHITIRSLDRLNADIPREKWHAKWEQLQSNLQLTAKKAVFEGDLDSLSNVLRHENTLALKLTNIYSGDENYLYDLVDEIVDSGVPVLFWSRGAEKNENWEEFIDENILSGTVKEIPARVLKYRQSLTLSGRKRDSKTFGFLWEDPNLIPPSRRSGERYASNFPPPLETEEFTIVTFEPQDDTPELELFPFSVATVRRPTTTAAGQQQQRQQQATEWEILWETHEAYRFLELLPGVPHLEMVSIPGGTFLMGSPESEPERDGDRESPQHQVTVESFFMGRYPVTQAQWRAVAALPQVTRELDRDPSRFEGDNRPVERVTWHDAVEFCARLSVHAGRQYRLPTEAEWEYACRAGTTTPFHFGETITSELANYSGTTTYADGPPGERRGETTPVDHFEGANAYGLTNMHGNVWEWCQDHWHSNYDGAPTDGSAWVEGGDSSQRVLRGGSWLNSPRYCRSAYRNVIDPDLRDFIFGFRVCCAAPRT